MAYVRTESSPRRALTIGAVAALHGAAFYALVSTFAATVFERIDVRMPTTNYTADPVEPTPEPTVEPSDAAEQKLVAPKPRLDLGAAADDTTVIDLPRLPLEPPGAGTGAGEEPLKPLPTPTTSFAPRAAVPLGNPGKWATSDDYPTRALREGRAGTTRFRVTIGADGRVRNCEVTGSSGSPDLDRATCENVARRARFKPATDESGAVVGGTYANAVRWEIPD